MGSKVKMVFQAYLIAKLGKMGSEVHMNLL
jgi:hypothetical protein